VPRSPGRPALGLVASMSAHWPTFHSTSRAISQGVTTRSDMAVTTSPRRWSWCASSSSTRWLKCEKAVRGGQDQIHVQRPYFAQASRYCSS